MRHAACGLGCLAAWLAAWRVLNHLSARTVASWLIAHLRTTPRAWQLQVRTRDELNKAREDEIRAIEKRKSKHIAALVASHEKAFADIKRFYNEITHR